SDVARSPIGRGADGLTNGRPLSRWFGLETMGDDTPARQWCTKKTFQSHRVRSDEASMRLVDLPPKASRDVLGYPILNFVCTTAAMPASAAGRTPLPPESRWRDVVDTGPFVDRSCARLGTPGRH